MEALVKFVGAIVVFAVVVFGISILSAYPVKWLVNDLFTPATINSLFGVTQLGFWKALELSVICGVLFKSSSSSSSKD